MSAPEFGDPGEPDEPGEPAGCALEAARPLSQSLLWRLQRNFYARAGIAAWSDGIVPQYITSNPWIADAYAQVVLGWLRDGLAGGTIAGGEPLYIVELGCGSGRFGSLFLPRLLELVARSGLAAGNAARMPVLRYVLTDFTAGHLDALRRHASLAPLVAAGHLDFARFDAGASRELRLAVSGERLAPGALANPLVVIANYVFDSMPQDCFRFGATGELAQCRVSLTSPQAEPDLDDPEILSRVEILWSEVPSAAAPYGEPDLDAVLAGYRAELAQSADTVLLFPVAALRTLRHLAAWSAGSAGSAGSTGSAGSNGSNARLLLLSADKGYARQEMLHGREEPGFAIHGSLSMMVNYHAIGSFFTAQGGEYLHTRHFAPELAVVSCLLGAPAGAAYETRLAFDNAIERRGPSDFFLLKNAIDSCLESHPEIFSLAQLLAWIRLSGWDANVFHRSVEGLLGGIAEASAAERAELREALQRVAESNLPLGDGIDTAFQVGALLCELDLHAEACPYFERSRELFGANPATLYNLALCHFQLGRRAEALADIEQAIRLAPELGEAVELRDQIAAAIAAAS